VTAGVLSAIVTTVSWDTFVASARHVL
jgi:hypothetical protein